MDTESKNNSTAEDYWMIAEVTARYVRAADHRDPTAMSALFDPEATVVIKYVRGGGDEVLLGELHGAQTIGIAVAAGMAPHPPRGWSHHTTTNPLVEVDGDTATSDSQFVVFNVVGDSEPDSGWPASASGAQGNITAVETGYYKSALVRRRGRWLINGLTIEHDLPYVFPQS